jgi:hypothetical protein
MGEARNEDSRKKGEREDSSLGSSGEDRLKKTVISAG